MDRKDRVKEITEKIEQGIIDVYNSKNFRDYLKVMSKFHKYSCRNSLLIYLQNPEATKVAGYKAWQTNFKRQVRKGEKGIEILAPRIMKVRTEVEDIDSTTDKKVSNKDDEVKTKIVESEKIFFAPVHVFDVSQTDGEPIPELISELQGEVKDYDKLFNLLEQISPYKVEFEKIQGGAKGYCNYTREKIAINEGMSDLQNIKTLIHEIAHAQLHNVIANKDVKNMATEQKEVEAESIAFTVCNYLGLDTSDYSFGYLASWSSGRDVAELKESLDTIQEQSSFIISKLEDGYIELEKAKDIKDNDIVELDNIHKLLIGEIENLIESKSFVCENAPKVTVEWSEHYSLYKGQVLSLGKANKLFGMLDEVQNKTRENSDTGAWYYKTKFNIEAEFNGEKMSYEGRQDFGDGGGSLIQHIEANANHYLNNLYMFGEEKGKEIKDNYESVLQEFVPYLKYHIVLEELQSKNIEQLHILQDKLATLPESNTLKNLANKHLKIAKDIDDLKNTLNKDILDVDVKRIEQIDKQLKVNNKTKSKGVER